MFAGSEIARGTGRSNAPRLPWRSVSRKRRDISQTILQPPLGSGPYRIKSFDTGRSVVYERVPDCWGSTLPVNIGTNNFRELRFDYFRDPSVAFEAFRAGSIDWRIENTAKNWATGYGFPAVVDKRVVLEERCRHSHSTSAEASSRTRG
jgi:microcin C transport system substrate-binding protein